MESKENEDWQLSLDVDDSDLCLTPVLRGCNSQHTRVDTTSTKTHFSSEKKILENCDFQPVRIIPGPAGIVQSTKLRKTQDIREGVEESGIPTQEYIRKIVEDVGQDEGFTRGPWVSAVDFVHNNGGTISSCLGDIKKFLKKGKLDQVVAIVKSCGPNALGELTMILKDPTGSITGTVHHKVVNEEGGYGRDITEGATLILANVSVFTPKESLHYLNITKRNIVKVFNKDTVPGSGSGVSHSGMLDPEEKMKMVHDEHKGELELQNCGIETVEEYQQKLDEEALILTLEEEARKKRAQQEWEDKRREEEEEHETQLYGLYV